MIDRLFNKLVARLHRAPTQSAKPLSANPGAHRDPTFPAPRRQH